MANYNQFSIEFKEENEMLFSILKGHFDNIVKNSMGGGIKVESEEDV